MTQCQTRGRLLFQSTVPCCGRIGLRLFPQLGEELHPEGGVEQAVDEEVDGRVEDEAEDGDVLEDPDPEWQVEALRVIPAGQKEMKCLLA